LKNLLLMSQFGKGPKRFGAEMTRNTYIKVM
jgi:hypothetical protein